MSLRSGDAIIWMSLGILGICGAYIARAQLLAVRNAARVTQPEKPPELISQHTEDALKLDTLRNLAFGSNQEIRNAALKIVVERVSQKPTYGMLLQNLAGKDVEKRDEALVSIKFLSQTSARRATQSISTMSAIIDCLCNMTNEDSVPPGDLTNLEIRTTAEQDALNVLCVSCGQSTNTALRAGLVNRWLAKYPFGGPHAPEIQKMEIIQTLRTNKSEDLVMNSILHAIYSEPEGRRQLRRHHLIGSAIGETPDDNDGDILMIGGEDVAGRSSFRYRNQRNSRVHEESPEEQALRRRRREAMVLSDGGAPLGRDNIIQGQELA
ncbi:hypothetical protein MMC13_007598 [Lambiella insularis]|nr:hypothetical protein [Lambiella insularis]